jgi:cytoskeletal protein RodZ
MPVGLELKQARERANLSAEEVSDRTKIQPHKIEALESGDFHALPYGVYLEGIVRAYAREVGLDQAALVERLRQEQPQLVDDWNLSLVDATPSNGRRASPIQTRPTPVDLSVDSFESEFEERAPTPPKAEPKSYAAPKSYTDNDERERPARGFAGLALPIVSLIAVIGWGAFFYQRMRPTDFSMTRDVATSANADERSARTETAADVPSETKAVLESTPGAVPPVSEAARDVARDRNLPPQRTPALAPPIPEPTIPPAVPKQDDRPLEGALPPANATRTGADKSIETPPTIDVSGPWSLATQVEMSSETPVAGSRLGYEIEMKQDGSHVEGRGRKITENGAALDSPAQTPISMTGTVQGNRLTLVFSEGSASSTVGKLVMLVEDGVMRGRFSSAAMRSSGTVEARRR